MKLLLSTLVGLGVGQEYFKCSEKCTDVTKPLCWVRKFDNVPLTTNECQTYEDYSSWERAKCSETKKFDCWLDTSEASSGNACDGNSIFKVTCLSDFKVKVEIENEACFKQEYDISPQDLIVKSSGTVVTGRSKRDAELTPKVDTTCKAYTDDKQTGSNWLYGDEALKQVLASDAKVFYFDGKQCSDDPKLVGDKLQYSAQIGSYVHSENDPILTKTAMLFSDITCNYDEDLSKDALNIAGEKLDLDPEDASKKSQVKDGEDGDLEIIVTKFTEDSDGKYEAIGQTDGKEDKVVLGDKVKIVFTSASSRFDIHIETCTAHNDMYEKESDGSYKKDNGKLIEIKDKFNDLTLVENDCVKTGDKQKIIKPTLVKEDCSGEKCAAFTFNQFAFTDTSSQSANPTLTFHMTCQIAMGESKTECPTNRRRRAAEETPIIGEVAVTVEVEAVAGRAVVDDGIVTSRADTTSADKTIVPVCSLIAFLAFLA